ncbi:hypothetical protein [Falsihalocynthiibacter arcticus]|uniref:Lipoprotein n=1 Tax=Falsihalocynthiibacter arcticus TaxID=1579316 RepID=A0A126UV52_9RHOB|nr:hypothetical protein [Falsihalocynthiibacter arcticus]AML49940.1 hypothetical protein RC74_00380 [Falsihalocynthiibacter arcticus]
MISESKILTVSYGTFSCTLEGFDDSFSTMKAIAEYFKTLAAEDRYFGAEPPAPDVEMLARIAEREVRSRVQAQIGDNGVVLRKSEETGAQNPTFTKESAPVSETPQAHPTAPHNQTVKMPAPVAVQLTQKTAPFVMAAATDGSESVAAKLQRIRAAVSRAPTNAPAEVIEDANSEDLFKPIASAFQDIEDDAEIVLPSAPKVAPVADEQATQESFEDSQVVEAVLEITIEDNDEEPTADLVEDADIVVSDVFEDTLEDIPELAVSLENDAEEELEFTKENSVDVSEPEAVSMDVESTSDDDAAVLAGVGAFMAQSEPSETVASIDEYTNEQGDEPLDATDITSILGTISQDDSTSHSDGAIQEDTHQDQEDDTFEGSLESRLETENVLSEAQSDEDLADLAKLDAPQDALQDEAPDTASVESSTEESIRTPKGSVSNVLARARARVIHVKKTDLEQVLEEDAVEEFLDVSASPQENAFTDDDTDDANETAEESILSAEDEAELMAELAAVTNETPDDIPTLEPLPEVTHYHSLSKQADEDNVNRLMDESDSKFAESDGTRRRSAIAHLKAAVAATVADRRILGGSKPKSDDTGAYRKDLAEVVRPNRAERRAGSSKDDRPAPLVLVSEQRIDLHDGPAVRPRRVGKSALELRDVNEDLSEGGRANSKTAKHLEESKSFAEFAERVGAIELPDLLEAAAAYASFVEGKEHFTRPDIMRRALQFAEDQGVSREEGLRSFGLLLRQGKIEKVKRGQFKIAQSTRFNPESRIAGE